MSKKHQTDANGKVGDTSINIHEPHLNIRCTRALGLSEETCKWVHEMNSPSYTPRWAEDGDDMGDAMFCINDLANEANAKLDENDPNELRIAQEINLLNRMCEASKIDYVQVDEPTE